MDKTMEKAMMDRFAGILRDYHLVDEGDGILVGLSGGPDSLCLFHLFHQIRQEWGLRLAAVHVNHGLRPGVCDREQEQVEQWCHKLDVPCYSKVIDCAARAKEKGQTSEEAGRDARYEAYQEAARYHRGRFGENLPVKVALAHHREDQAETVMMRILRGTGPDGLAGMDYKRQEAGNLWVIRPLLGFSKNELVQYLQEKGEVPHRDATNFQPIYQRNRIRLDLFPILEKEYNPNIVEALCRLADGSREDRDLLDQLAETALTSVMKSWDTLRRDLLMEVAPSLRKRIYVKMLYRLGMKQDYTLRHLTSMEELLKQNRTGSGIHLPGGYGCEMSYGEMRFFREDEKHGNTEERDWEWEKALDKITLPQGAGLRSRKPGDYLLLSGGGRKKLQDYYVDEKIPRRLREDLPVIAINDQVLAVLGKDILEEVMGDSLPTGWPLRTRTSEGYFIKFEGGYWIIEQNG